MSIQNKTKNYVWCKECQDMMACGISGPGFGCDAGKQIGLNVPGKSEMVLCLQDENLRPITEGTVGRIIGLAAIIPNTVALPISEAFYYGLPHAN